MNEQYKTYAFAGGAVAGIAIAILALSMSVSEFKSWEHPNGQVATITVSGEGEVTAAPDIATITFTVRESAKTVPLAQKAVEAKVKQAMDSFSSLNVSAKDTKTISYTINPKYETQMIYCITAPCQTGKTIITGYEVANTIQIKVRKIDQAGEVLGLVGKANITEVSGPDFTVDDMDTVQAQAKEKAIANAKEKAKKTARALGVSLGSISQFNEDAGYVPYYRAEAMSYGKAANTASDAVSVPQGENVIKSKVTITYTLD